MLDLYEVIVLALEEITSDAEFDASSRSEALGYMKSLRSSDYIISCLVINKALSVLQPISVKLQGVAVDVIATNEMVGYVVAELKKSMRRHSRSYLIEQWSWQIMLA